VFALRADLAGVSAGITDDPSARRLTGLAGLFYLRAPLRGGGGGIGGLRPPLGKTAVSAAVHAAGEKVKGLRRDAVPVSMAGLLVSALGAAVTSVQCKGEWLTVGVTTDALTGTTLTSDLLDNGEADTLPAWLAAVAGSCRRKCGSRTMPMASRRRPMRTACSIRCARSRSCTTARLGTRP